MAASRACGAIRTLGTVGWTACAFVVVSCNSDSGLYPVHGKVLYHGKAAVGAEVIFHPEGDNSVGALRPVGTVLEDGSFTLISRPKGEGAPAGKYYVFVRWLETETPEGRKAAKKEKRFKFVPADILHDRYQDHKNPKFLAEIKPGKNELRPFEVED